MFVGRVLTHPITNNLFRKIDRVCHFHRRVCDSLEFISTRSSLPREPLFKRSLRTSCCFYEMATSRADDSASFRNRLSKEKSPYLLQHASNPVDWYPWGEEAFAKARVEDKLIFLSVGYSTCHWCHVMERESFEDPSIASIMNEFFVNIKVDREERPDVDKIYMSFVQGLLEYPPPQNIQKTKLVHRIVKKCFSSNASSGSGGWPMSVFLTPDLQPVAGGTYYPPKDQFGRPGFKTVLLNMAKQWTDQRQKVSSTGVRITELLRQTTTFDVNIAGALIAGEVPGREVWDLCSIQFQERYEPVYGGFSPTMKFPQPSNFSFLFHLMYKEASTDTGRLAQKMALHTLDRMADGGIHDHIAQGFARYSTDKKWHVPHFEKMLYDQAQLAVAYSTAYLATKDNKYAAVVRDILTYVSRDLSHKDGGFFSAEDADSHPDEGSSAKREGAFYVWEYDKVVELLNQPLTSKPDVKLHQVFCHYYHILPEGNVDPELDPHEELKNQNVLAVFGSLKKTSEKFHVKIEDLENELEHGRIILYNERRKRPKPQLDNKIITSWNGLMISGYARAASALGDKSYADRAVSAGQFIKKHLCTADNKLLRSCYTNGDTVEQISRPIPGFLDDYACLIRGLIDLYEATFDQEWLIWAEKLQSVQDELFWDHGLAGYFATSNDDSSLLLRMKEDMDGAEPSGNSVAAHNLLKLSTILDSADLKDKVEKLLSSFTSRLTRAPVVLPEMVSALMLYHDPPTQVVVTGNMENAETAELVTVARQRWLPGMVIMTTDNSPDNNYLCLKNQAVAKMKKLGDRQAAYVCHGRTCTLPVTTAGELADLLKTQ